MRLVTPRPEFRASRTLCLGAAAVLLCVAGCAAERPPDQPPVVLITLESLRTDVVAAYGGASSTRPEEPVTPMLDALAAGATLYTDAHAVTSWTLASHASLFTGLYPAAHQTQGPMDRLGDDYATLGETLAMAGYETVGVVSGPYLRRRHNLHQGFERWHDDLASPINGVAHDDVTNPGMVERIRAVLDSRDEDRPLFLFAYFWDSHFDFLPPAPYDALYVPDDAEPFDARGFDANPAIHPYMAPERLRWLRSQYAGDARWTDAALGEVLDALRAHGLYDEALVIVTADHGEEFFEHGAKGHKKNLHAETVRVPLVIKYPGQREGARDDRLVSLVDVVPTVLDVVAQEPAASLEGFSLRGAAPPDRAIAFDLHATWYAAGGAREQRWRAVRDATHKLLWSEGGGAPGRDQLYDVARDPGERDDLASQRAARVEALRARYAALVATSLEIAAAHEAGGEASLASEEREQLEALGYLRPGP